VDLFGRSVGRSVILQDLLASVLYIVIAAWHVLKVVHTCRCVITYFVRQIRRGNSIYLRICIVLFLLVYDKHGFLQYSY
jgi:hypothetical protein